MTKVLFLCHGNICRSPMAEFIFKNMTKGYDVHAESMAVSSEEIGNPIYPSADAALRRHAIPHAPHRARRLTRADYDSFDYVVIMEESNKRLLYRIIGSDDEHKVRRLLDFTSRPGDIEDPWYTGNFEKVYSEIEEGCAALLEHLKKNKEI